MIKILAFVGAGLLLGGALAAAVVLGVVPVPFGPLADARAAAEKAKPKPAVTVMYPTKERVVNLTDKASPRYLKVSPKDEFAKEMSGHAAIIDDALVTTLSAKGSPELLKPDGKDQLKTELIERVNHALHEEEKVVNVYFTSFIIQ